ncbi:hypothetical protein IEQ34_002903 [Dendrobium chrysotoxum]|uniref:Cyclic nucleotide-binding domain-containing protein n=1 Tax=Dendrobium chrysotoxum TaxID=161865 RepID=A0AAV7HKN4_DENCH|nr:hypothetical protein IEQ34_002903 [Dendrobium chrysotoxum]
MLRCPGLRDFRFLPRFPFQFSRAKCSSSSSAAMAEAVHTFDFYSACSSTHLGGAFRRESHSLHGGRFFRAEPKDYRISRLRDCHAQARHGRLKETRNILRHIIGKEGPGSAPSLCALLCEGFQNFDSNIIVWDMLANVYAQSEMANDALFVLRRMDALNIQASISTYDSLLYSLEHSDILFDIYEEIKFRGISSSEFTDSIFIRALCRQKRLQEASSFFQLLRERKEFIPCIVILNSLISGFCKAGFLEISMSFLSMALRYGLIPDKYSYAPILHGLCLKGSLEEALDVSVRMERDGIDHDIVTYNILMNGCRLHGYMSEVYLLIHELFVRGLKPDLVTYTILITGHCDQDNLEYGLRMRKDIMKHGIRLNIIAYSVLLSALCKKGCIKEMEMLFDEMEDIGLHIDLVAYSILIRGYCRLGHIDKALEACEVMHSKKLNPNSFIHGAFLSSLCKEGMMAEAKRYLDNLCCCGQSIDVILYNIVIDGYVKAGDFNGAIELYYLMLKQGLTPTVVTWNSLLLGLCKTGRLHAARDFLRYFESNGVAPTAVTYTTLMDAFGKSGYFDVMLELLDEMIGKAITPNVVTYSVVMKGLCRNGRLNEAVKLLKGMNEIGLEADAITYNTIIQGFCEVSNLKMAFHVLGEMLEHDVSPTSVTYNLLINVLCLKGKLENAEHLLDDLLVRGVCLRKFAYSTVIKAQCVMGMPKKAILLFERMATAGFEVSINDYYGAINRLCKRSFVGEAIIFFNMMLQGGILPDQELAYVMCSALLKKYYLFSFFTLQTMMIKLGLHFFHTLEGGSEGIRFCENMSCDHLKIVFDNGNTKRFDDGAELGEFSDHKQGKFTRLKHIGYRFRILHKKSCKSLKRKVLSRVFSEDYDSLQFEKIFSPHGSFINLWNKVLLGACLVSLFVDPLFFYLPGTQEVACTSTSKPFKVVLTIVRSLADVLYAIQIFVHFHTAYVAPSSHVFGRGELIIDPLKIASRYLSKAFWLDFIAALPFPQFLVWVVIPNLKSSTTSNTWNFVRLSIMLQYLPRFFSIFPLTSKIVETSGVITETAWAGAAYNLILYMLVSHVLGASWYLLAFSRQIACWKEVCHHQSPACQYQYLRCQSLGSSRNSWFQSSNITVLCSPDNNFFQYGIYAEAVNNRISSLPFLPKFFYCLWWGLKNLSSLGQNLETGTFVGEICFAILVAVLGLVLFGLLIGNVQSYLQATTARLEEWRIKRNDAERWMQHRQLPAELRQCIRRYNEYKWLATRGVDEQAVLGSLPLGLRREIKRHLCLNLVRRVPLFDEMDERMLEAICERLRPVLYTRGTYLFRELDPVEEMSFIIRGHLNSHTTGGGRTGFLESCHLAPGDFCGEELLSWALESRTVQSTLPSSTRTVRAVTDVEAFVVGIHDLHFVAAQFRMLHSKQLRQKFRFYSHQWRTWAACFIQAAWRRNHRRRVVIWMKEKGLSSEED